MNKALLLTLNTLKDKRIIKYLIFSFFLSILIVALFIAGVSYLSSTFIHIKYEWLKTTLVALFSILTGIAGWFLFPTLNMFVGSIFQEPIIEIIKEKYYKDIEVVPNNAFFKNLFFDLKFALVSLLINIAILPFYFLGMGIIIAFIVNSILIGLEYYYIVLGFFYGRQKAKELTKTFLPSIISNGFLYGFASICPILNLFVAIIGIIFQTHYFFYNQYKHLKKLH